MNTIDDTMLIVYVVNRAYMCRNISKFTTFNELQRWDKPLSFSLEIFHMRIRIESTISFLYPNPASSLSILLRKFIMENHLTNIIVINSSPKEREQRWHI